MFLCGDNADIRIYSSMVQVEQQLYQAEGPPLDLPPGAQRTEGSPCLLELGEIQNVNVEIESWNLTKRGRQSIIRYGDPIVRLFYSFELWYS